MPIAFHGENQFDVDATSTSMRGFSGNLLFHGPWAVGRIMLAESGPGNLALSGRWPNSGIGTELVPIGDNLRNTSNRAQYSSGTAPGPANTTTR